MNFVPLTFPNAGDIMKSTIHFQKEVIRLKFLRQIFWIILFSCLGELCRYLIPYPIPASIYGMVLMFIALATKILPLDEVKDAGNFLVSFLPILFIAPTVNILACWDAIKNNLLVLVLIIIIPTVLTFGVAGSITQWFIRRKQKKNGGSDHE